MEGEYSRLQLGSIICKERVLEDTHLLTKGKEALRGREDT